MRIKDREVKDFDQIISIIDKCKVLHLAMISEGKPYVVPVNFGYTVNEIDGEKKLSVYFHGAGEGKKVDALKTNPSVCFSCDSCDSIESGNGSDDPCSWTCFYESVIGDGKVSFLDSKKEKETALDSIMLHNGYKLSKGVKFIAYNAMTIANVMVAKIEVDCITGKRHKKK